MSGSGTDGRLYMGRFRIVIDHDLCQGHGVCLAEAPQLFRLIETDSPYLQSEPVAAQFAAEALACARSAEKFCPNRAITVIESPNGERT
jgi:ferredoxin